MVIPDMNNHIFKIIQFLHLDKGTYFIDGGRVFEIDVELRKPKCFWCETAIKDKSTKDHLFSNYYAKTFNYDRTFIVVACQRCNNMRGRISAMFQLVHRLHVNGMSSNIQHCHRDVRKLFREVDVYSFRKRISEKFKGKLKARLLREIDDLIAFTPHVDYNYSITTDQFCASNDSRI
jgi:hypothetical protein